MTTKKVLIGLGVLTLGVLAYKHYKKMHAPKKAPVVLAPISTSLKAVENPATGQPELING